MSDNEKRQKFEELAQKRVAKVCDDIRILGNLSNKASYDYTEVHVKQIFAAIQVQLDRTKSEFGDKKKAPGFAFVNIPEAAPAPATTSAPGDCPTTTVTAAPAATTTETNNPGLTIPA